MDTGPKERVYDERISPLMTQIIAECKAAGIPVYASFQLDGDLACTTYICPKFEEVPEGDYEHVFDFRSVHDRAERGMRGTPAVLAITITSRAAAVDHG